MIELELRKINYTEGGNNYVARAEAYHLFENKLNGVIKVAVEP